MGFIGTQQLLLILLIVLVLFGAKKIPELAKGLGAGVREFKKAANEIQRDAADSTDELLSQPEKSSSTGDKDS